jgi:hypothetical protein
MNWVRKSAGRGKMRCLGSLNVSWKKREKNLFWRKAAVKQEWAGMLHLSLRQHYLHQV